MWLVVWAFLVAAMGVNSVVEEDDIENYFAWSLRPWAVALDDLPLGIVSMFLNFLNNQ